MNSGYWLSLSLLCILPVASFGAGWYLRGRLLTGGQRRATQQTIVMTQEELTND